MRGLHFWILQKCLDSEESEKVLVSQERASGFPEKGAACPNSSKNLDLRAVSPYATKHGKNDTSTPFCPDTEGLL